MSEELKFDHFKNINELLQHIDIWYKEDDIDYTRWFHLEDLKKVKDYITNLQQENKHLNLQLDQALKDYEELLIKIDKAIEYINNLKTYPFLEKYCVLDLLKILGDKE